MDTVVLPPLPTASHPGDGLWAGALLNDPRAGRPGGRVRRWAYTGAGSADAAVGAAIVDLGFVSTAFAWALVDDRLLTWEAKALPRAARIGDHAGVASTFAHRGATVTISEHGDLDVDVPVEGGRLTARVDVTPDTSAVCITPTPRGGWNATQKVAGERARVHLRVPGTQVTTTGGAWRDWTLGAQDRHTSWRWAAGAGASVEGRRVGINASTGMNGIIGEDVVWWDGVPHRLEVDTIAPVDALQGDWVVAGPGWRLDVEVGGVRAADENLLLVRSRYVQPVGTMEGTLPGPDGEPVEVTLVGVTEDHDARW